MRQQDLIDNSTGRLVKNLDGNLAFVPSDLPPAITWSDSLVLAITQADHRLGELAGLARNLPNPKRLVRMFLRREAELSSLIENTFGRVQSMLLFEQLPAIEKETPSVREVHNNFLALEFAITSARHRTITRALIKEMHAVLLRGVRGSDKMPGQFRTTQAHIGRTADISQARFVPCPPLAIESCMEGFEKYLNGKDSLPSIARAALVHYQFEAIHPFADGNGRVGRALLMLQLVREGILPAPLLNPSAQLELHREEYYDRLFAVSQGGWWVEWIEFFSRSIADEAADAIRRIERLEMLRAHYHQVVRRPRASALLPKLIDELFAEPSVTIPGTAKLLGVTQAAAFQLLSRLLDAKIIREVTGKARNRVYLAQEIVDLFSDKAIKKNPRE
jgi:Fic family protein